MFPLLLWIIPLLAIFAYLVTWPSTRPWPIRLAFDTSVLLILVLVCLTIRPVPVPDPREAAEAVQWQPYLSAIYVAALSVLFLGIAGTVRHFIFRRRA